MKHLKKSYIALPSLVFVGSIFLAPTLIHSQETQQKNIDSLTTSTVAVYKPSTMNLEGLISIPGDTLIVKDIYKSVNNGDEVKIMKNQIKMMGMSWTYTTRLSTFGYSSEGVKKLSEMPIIFSNETVNATPVSIVIFLKDSTKIFPDLASIRPKYMNLIIKVKGSDFKLSLPFTDFTENYKQFKNDMKFAFEAIKFTTSK